LSLLAAEVEEILLALGEEPEDTGPTYLANRLEAEPLLKRKDQSVFLPHIR